ncbi:hypothetical protein BTH38_04655 [Bacillus toyonensis]|uniref:hypothetical protein n=1 Tax=Bacillus toyonensis TaxID=155322 RepID=UPI000A19DDE5|nr:hypothetical protein [Bacillus toyonensis]OSM14691.1 hypothetical protein BTH38_04655 [Bacillus toyonensis]
MKNFEMETKNLGRRYEEQMKAFKEMAFFLELGGLTYSSGGNHNACLYVGLAEDEVDFEIWLENGQYVLASEFYRSGFLDNNGNRVGVITLDKIKRTGAKTIVNNIIRISNNIDDLVKAKLYQQEKWKREREESAERYKQKIREEVIAELQKEAKSKEPAKKRTRKSVKKTENTENITALPPVPPAPQVPEIPKTPTDILNDPFPDF